MSSSPIIVNSLGDAETITFAAEELQAHLAEMIDNPVELVDREAYYDVPGLWVGTITDLSSETVATRTLFDDGIIIDTEGRNGVIAGVNQRSTLLAVYRYLRENGCRWPRPGPDGELIPTVDGLADVEVTEQPSHRHRGITIEGSVSEQHVLDIIDWAPKVGFNSYFLQFFDSYPFFERWYNQEAPDAENRDYSIERAREIHGSCIEEIKKRDLVYHAVGHGWTARAVDLPVRGWDNIQTEVPEEVTEYFAEIDGERTLYRDVPVNTELCYSNPEARQRLVETIVDYAEDHPEIDVLHVWPSDGHNNHCECTDCKGTRPSDLYVRVLNELDSELAVRGLDTQIAFLMYTDLLWPPEEEILATPERFILMFAPITRSYTESYSETDSADLPDLPSYDRNELTYPTSLTENVAFLSGWQDAFQGDAFAFDYHLGKDHFRDMGQFYTTSVLADDMECLSDIGLNGNMSCQVQRTFFPTGLPMVAMGRKLWDADYSLEAIVADHFEASFGEDATVARSYLEAVTDGFRPVYEGHDSLQPGSTTPNSETVAATIADAVTAVSEYKPKIEAHAERHDGVEGASWQYLAFHADIVEGLATGLEQLARGEDDHALSAWLDTREHVQELTTEIHSVFDVYTFLGVYDEIFGYKPESID